MKRIFSLRAPRDDGQLRRLIIAGICFCSLNLLPAQGLTTPSRVQASDGVFPDMIQVEWNEGLGVNFEVWRSSSADRGQAQLLDTEWWNFYMDRAVVAGQQYYYWIRAVSGDQTSDFSAPDSGYASQADTNRWRLTVNAGNHGRVMKSSSEETFSPGSMIVLTAVADVGYNFTGWSGDATGTDNPLTIYIRSNMVVNANFEQRIVSGGSITIYIRPEGAITAGAKWKLKEDIFWRDSGTTFNTDTFKTYTIMFLHVSGWVNPPEKEITIAQNMPNISWTVDYTQSGSGFTITLQSEHGSIQKEPDQTTYQAGTSVKFTARPDPGYKFSYWAGDLQGSVNPVSINIQGDKTVRAVFEPTTIPSVGEAKASHTCTGYSSPGTATIVGKIEYPIGKKLLSLKWTSPLPTGWLFTAVTGNGNPEIQQNEIVWTGTLSENPVTISLTATVPAGQSGEKTIHGAIEYQLEGMINPAQATVTPDPLIVNTRSYHTADFRDPRWIIDGTEVNRVLSYWRAGGYHAEAQGSDGYAAGAGGTLGNRHSADYKDPAWMLDGTEVNRVLSYWRSGSYHTEALGADGYAAGVKPSSDSTDHDSRLARHLQTVGTEGVAAQQSGPAQYQAGSTLRVTNQISYTGTLWSLLWRVQMPNGWQLLNVEGDGNPEKQGAEVVWTGSIPPSPIQWIYVLQVPASSLGNQSIRAEVEYQLAGAVNPTSRFAQPDPLVLNGVGAVGPEIQIYLHAGVSISGTVGQNYLIEVNPNADDPNGWTTIGNLTLTNASQIWFDPNPAHGAKKFYRVKASP